MHPGPAAKAPGCGEVQLWQACVPADEGRLASLFRALSPEEHERAARFLAPMARREFIFGRAFLRQLLGAALSVEPADLAFDLGPAGKPRLRTGNHPIDLRFNLSHSGGRVVIALAMGREVGVDMEWMKGLEAWQEVSERYFSPRELAELNALPQAEQRLAFFNGWTRKEAWLKATGAGLSEDLCAIEVTTRPGCPAQWLALPGGPAAMRRWMVRDIPLPEGFAGAVVCEKQNP